MKSPLLHSFEYGLDFLREQVADVSPEDMAAQPKAPDGRVIANHPAWLIGHLTLVFQNIGGAIGMTPWLPEDFNRRYSTGVTPVSDAAAYESKEKALAMLRDAQARIMQAVERLDEAKLNEPFPDPSYRDVFPTIGHALVQVLVGHTAYHVGQLSVWRKAMGLPGLGRVFE